MPLPKLLLVAESDGYSAQPGNEVVSVDLDGGAPRYRKDKIGANAQINIKFTLSARAFDYLMAFYRVSIDHGSLPFLIDLILDTSDVAEYTAHFAKPPALAGQRGLTYFVTATLDVVPDPPDTATDTATIALGPY